MNLTDAVAAFRHCPVLALLRYSPSHTISADTAGAVTPRRSALHQHYKGSTFLYVSMSQVTPGGNSTSASLSLVQAT